MDLGSLGLVPSFQFLGLALDFRGGECSSVDVVRLNFALG